MFANLYGRLINRPAPFPRIKRRNRFSLSILPYLLILPGFVFVAAFTLYPVASLVLHSFLRQNFAHPDPQWAGIFNFVHLFTDPLVAQVMANTGLYVLEVVPISVSLGLLLAVGGNQNGMISRFLRTSFFYPIVLPLVSVSAIWLFLFTPEYGLLHFAVHLLKLPEPALLRNPRLWLH